MTGKKISELPTLAGADMQATDQIVVARASTSQNFSMTRQEFLNSSGALMDSEFFSEVARLEGDIANAAQSASADVIAARDERVLAETARSQAQAAQAASASSETNAAGSEAQAASFSSVAVQAAGAAASRNLVIFNDYQETGTEGWSHTQGTQSNVPPGAPAGSLSLRMGDGARQIGAPYFGDMSGRRLRVSGWIDATNATGAVVLLLRQATPTSGNLISVALRSGTNSVPGGTGWTFVDGVIEVMAATEYWAPAIDLGSGTTADFYDLRFEDVTESEAAGASATAAALSASTAQASETAAGSHAAAAQSAQTSAETAEANAIAAEVSAGSSETSAAGSAASALASATLAARTSTRGASVFRAPTLWSSTNNNYMDRWSTGGTLTITPGTVYEAGWDWTFDVTDTQDTGLQMHTYHPGWFGAKDVEAFIVEVEFTLNSGSMDGAGVYAAWYNTTGSGNDATCRLADMEISGAIGEVQTASTILKRPAGFTGTFDKIHSHFLANWSGFLPRAAKNITVHRWSMIPTSINEARIDRIETLDLSTGTALATFLNEMQVDANGNSAAVATFSQTSADVTGFASAFSGVAVSTNGGNVAGFYLSSWADPDGSGGAVMKLLGDVIVPGTISTNLLSVGLGQNMVPDPRFSEGLAHWSANVTSGTGGADTTFEVRPVGQTWAGPVDPTLMMFQATAATDGYRQRELKPVIDADGGVAHGFPVVAGRTYSASVRASAHRCNVKAWVRWMDAAGAHISYSAMGTNAANEGSSTQPNTWPLLSVVAEAPAGAFYGRLMVRKEATWAGASPATSYAFWAEPMFAETHADATEPSPYSPPGQTVIDGNRLRTGSVTAEKITVADLAALNITVVNADIENATLTTAKLAAGAIQRTYEWFSDVDVTVAYGLGWTQIMSKTITTYNSNPVLISVIIESSWAYGDMEMKIERDGVNILDTGAYPTRLFQKTAPDLMFSDRPGAGTFTYTVSIKQQVEGTNTLKRRHMVLQQGMS